MIRIKIAPEYQANKDINEFINQVPLKFDDGGTMLHDERNTIKDFTFDNPHIPFGQLVVKRYKVPIFVQRVAYSFFRKSKAMRAFNYARELRKRGINTPHEVAFIEEYHNRLIKSTYIVTCFTDGRPIKDFITISEGINTQVAQEFARFAKELHVKGILHHDLNPTNVLYHPTVDKHYFSVIDINRMKFKQPGSQLTPAECFENLTRFTGRMDLFEYVLRHYIKERGWNEDLIKVAIKMKIRHDEQRIRRKAFLKNLKKICHV